ncbi:hypothetical protein TFKS16_0492 [Tannerella forsythia KS16]|nr:hypothetical protein TFKS16_0492 [Tannerella forsythia KS16]
MAGREHASAFVRRRFPLLITAGTFFCYTNKCKIATNDFKAAVEKVLPFYNVSEKNKLPQACAARGSLFYLKVRFR